MSHRHPSIAAVLVVLVLLVVAPASAATTVTTDTISVVKEDTAPGNAEVAVALSQATFPGPVDTVVIGRDDVFADSLASGVLQDSSPLLLVPPHGPIPADVQAELDRLHPSRAIVLGGEAAISPDVEAALTDLGIAVERRAGPTRFQTAVAIAAVDAAGARTALLARAFAADDAVDPTQAFADALAGGGYSAEETWPVLLTHTDELPQPTRDHLASSALERVVILGGEAAVSQAVADEIAALGLTVERIAGADRFETATALAEKAGTPVAAEADRVVLVEGQAPNAFAGGFAAAAHVAAFDAPMVLANGDGLPAATRAFLSSAGYTVDPADPSTFPVLTCVASPTACEAARQELGLPPAAQITAEPSESTPVTGGSQVVLRVSGQRPATLPVDGSCLDGPTEVPLAGEGTVVQLAADLPEGTCELRITLELPNGATQTTTFTYPTA